MTTGIRIGVSILVLLLLNACERADQRPSVVTLMTFNVENLFDTEDDPGKDDYTYLPLAKKQTDEHQQKCAGIAVDRWRDQCLNWDWNEDIVERKLVAIADTILHVNNGRGPDVLAMQEVENIGILERLRTQYLADAGYGPAVLIDGDDQRGVDVALLSRLPLHGEPRLHSYSGSDFDAARQADTRGILEATFELPDGSLLTGFVVHFPAPFHPTQMRVVAYDQLNALKNALPDDRYAFAAGDFNTIAKEVAEQRMLERFAYPYWTVVHEQDCRDCKGTNYYAREDSWSFLDMLFWSAPEKRGVGATWGIRAGSVAVANTNPEQVSKNGTPKRFQSPSGSGVSDHWPLIFDIELK